MRDFISKWTHGEDWRTWVAHGALAIVYMLAVVPVAMLLSWLVPGLGISWALAFVIGAFVAVGFYLLRELDQIVYAVVDRKQLHPFDHFMDVASPLMAVTPFVVVSVSMVT